MYTVSLKDIEWVTLIWKFVNILFLIHCLIRTLVMILAPLIDGTGDYMIVDLTPPTFLFTWLTDLSSACYWGPLLLGFLPWQFLLENNLSSDIPLSSASLFGFFYSFNIVKFLQNSLVIYYFIILVKNFLLWIPIDWDILPMEIIQR